MEQNVAQWVDAQPGGESVAGWAAMVFDGAETLTADALAANLRLRAGCDDAVVDAFVQSVSGAGAIARQSVVDGICAVIAASARACAQEAATSVVHAVVYTNAVFDAVEGRRCAEVAAEAALEARWALSHVYGALAFSPPSPEEPRASAFHDEPRNGEPLQQAIDRRAPQRLAVVSRGGYAPTPRGNSPSNGSARTFVSARRLRRRPSERSHESHASAAPSPMAASRKIRQRPSDPSHDDVDAVPSPKTAARTMPSPKAAARAVPSSKVAARAVPSPKVAARKARPESAASAGHDDQTASPKAAAARATSARWSVVALEPEAVRVLNSEEKQALKQYDQKIQTAELFAHWHEAVIDVDAADAAVKQATAYGEGQELPALSCRWAVVDVSKPALTPKRSARRFGAVPDRARRPATAPTGDAQRFFRVSDAGGLEGSARLPAQSEVSSGVVVRSGTGGVVSGDKFTKSGATMSRAEYAAMRPATRTERSVADKAVIAPSRPATAMPSTRTPRSAAAPRSPLRPASAPLVLRPSSPRPPSRPSSPRPKTPKTPSAVSPPRPKTPSATIYGLDGRKRDNEDLRWQVLTFTTDSAQLPVPLSPVAHFSGRF
ncbi:hypothetical protein M885DRAFT_509552 [Pelagophyceae sp. CCMP2097]|nr:hypothetical protein M885DRAFT_509552 [Pelagophyceae sp. CCMP2097]